MTNECTDPAVCESRLKKAFVAVIDGPREVWKGFVNRLRGVRDITPVEADRLIRTEGAFVLDVREQHEYDTGHLSDSLLIPLGQLPDRVAELEEQKNRPIVVICLGGKRSADACALLAKRGFAHTFNIAGGILAWRKANLTTTL